MNLPRFFYWIASWFTPEPSRVFTGARKCTENIQRNNRMNFLHWEIKGLTKQRDKVIKGKQKDAKIIAGKYQYGINECWAELNALTLEADHE